MSVLHGQNSLQVNIHIMYNVVLQSFGSPFEHMQYICCTNAPNQNGFFV